MSGSRLAHLVSLASAAALAACGAQAAATECDELVPAPVSIDGAVTLGLVDGDGFVAIADGAALELELGTQGGWMVRPAVEIDGAALGAEPGACVWVESTAVIDGAAESLVMTHIPAFEYADDRGRSSPLVVLLSFDLEDVDNRDVTIDVRVEGPSASSTATVNAKLVNLE